MREEFPHISLLTFHVSLLNIIMQFCRKSQGKNHDPSEEIYHVVATLVVQSREWSLQAFFFQLKPLLQLSIYLPSDGKVPL
jgi:hypothetical protein